VPRAASVMIDS